MGNLIYLTLYTGEEFAFNSQSYYFHRRIDIKTEKNPNGAILTRIALLNPIGFEVFDVVESFEEVSSAIIDAMPAL